MGIKYVKSNKVINRFVKLGRKVPAIRIKEYIEESVGYSGGIKDFNFENDFLFANEQKNINYEKTLEIIVTRRA